MRAAAATAVAAAVAAMAGAAPAATYPLPPINERLFGDVTHDVAGEEDALVDIARRNRLGYEELVLANPGVDRWLPKPGTQVVLPTRFILPWGAREGLVVNLAESRLYYFPKPKRGAPRVVETFALSAGRDEWPTPRLTTRISRKLHNPAWYPNRAIRAEHAADGDPLPAVVPPGPDNPLGPWVLKLGIPGGYFIHGTKRPFGIGMAVTHGCLRLYPEDIEALFPMVEPGTPVRIITEPYKATWKDDALFLEAHPPLDAEGNLKLDRAALERRLNQALKRKPGRVVDPAWFEEFVRQPGGIPVPVPLLTSVATS